MSLPALDNLVRIGQLKAEPRNETETRAEHIDPALKATGWGVVEGSRIRRA